MAESSYVRDYYPIAEAAELLDYQNNDLIHLAAKGKIPIYVNATRWMAKRIYQYDHSIELGDDLRSRLKVTYRGTAPPEMPETHAPDHAAKEDEWLDAHDSRDIVIGNMVDFSKHGKYRALYEITLDGHVPVAEKCFKEFLIRPETAKVEIDLYRYLDMAAGAQDMFLVPENEPLVQDTLNSGKLVVLTEDIKRFLDSKNGSYEDKEKPTADRDVAMQAEAERLARQKMVANPKRPVTKREIAKDLSKIPDFRKLTPERIERITHNTWKGENDKKA